MTRVGPSQRFLETLDGFGAAFALSQRELLREKRITLLQYFVLRRLSRGGPVTLSSLVQLLGVRPPTMTSFIDSLVSFDWVRREENTTDRRATVIRLTPKGERLMGDLRKALVRRFKSALKGVPPASLTAATHALELVRVKLAATQTSPPAGRSLL